VRAASSEEAARKVEMESTIKATNRDGEALGKGRETREERRGDGQTRRRSYNGQA
jgi:hypothetical protein